MTAEKQTAEEIAEGLVNDIMTKANGDTLKAWALVYNLISDFDKEFILTGKIKDGACLAALYLALLEHRGSLEHINAMNAAKAAGFSWDPESNLYTVPE